MQARASRWLAGATAVLLLGGMPGATAEPGGGPAARAAEEIGAALEGLLGDIVDLEDVLGAGGLKVWQVPGGVRVLVVSSGVDVATFGDGYAGRIHHHGGGGDALGLGTYATSVVLQVAPQSVVTSFNVYDDNTVRPAKVAQALRFAREHAADLDAVLLAFPPGEVLDPRSRPAPGSSTGRSTCSPSTRSPSRSSPG